jgi:chromosome segregation ATPase
MGRITNLQNQIGELQQVLQDRNQTIATKNRELSEAHAKQASDADTIKKLHKELNDARAQIAAA